MDFKGKEGRSRPSSVATADVALNFRVPFEMRRRIKISAAERGLTMAEFLSDAIAQYLSDSDGSVNCGTLLYDKDSKK